MTDIVLRDIDSRLAERIRRIGDKRGWSPAETLLKLLERGLDACEGRGMALLDDGETNALASAIAAMESVPDDAGFALIGRATPDLPKVEQPEQRISPEYELR